MTELTTVKLSGPVHTVGTIAVYKSECRATVCHVNLGFKLVTYVKVFEKQGPKVFCTELFFNFKRPVATYGKQRRESNAKLSLKYC